MPVDIYEQNFANHVFIERNNNPLQKPDKLNYKPRITNEGVGFKIRSVFYLKGLGWTRNYILIYNQWTNWMPFVSSIYLKITN